MRRKRVARRASRGYPWRMTDDRYHYALVARAIAEIDAADGPLPLPALAARLGMSEAHFQRLFSAWAGVSPKRYQQYLALGQARDMLAQSASLAETADAIGLSGPSRLHDMFLRWEAMTPGEFAAGGAGLRLTWAEVDTPYGPAVAVASPRGLCALSFIDSDAGESLAALAPRWPAAELAQDRGDLAPRVAALLQGKGGLPLAPVGGPFQIKVWQALLDIPAGAVTTYAAIAARIASPAAHRAVGTAVGQNPLAVLIPCHRVIRKDGTLGGYRWGLTRKRAILAREAVQADNP